MTPKQHTMYRSQIAIGIALALALALITAIRFQHASRSPEIQEAARSEDGSSTDPEAVETSGLVHTGPFAGCGADAGQPSVTGRRIAEDVDLALVFGRVAAVERSLDLSRVVVLAWQSGRALSQRDVAEALEGTPPPHVAVARCKADGSYEFELEAPSLFAFGAIGDGACSKIASTRIEGPEVAVPELQLRFLYGAVVEFVDASTGESPRGHASGRTGVNSTSATGLQLTLLEARSMNPLSTYLASALKSYEGSPWTQTFLVATPYPQSPKVELNIHRPGYEQTKTTVQAYSLARSLDVLVQSARLVPTDRGWGLIELALDQPSYVASVSATETVTRENLLLSLTNVVTGSSSMVLATASSDPLQFEFPEGSYRVQLRSLDSPNRPALSVDTDLLALQRGGVSTLRYGYQDMGHIALAGVQEHYSDPETELQVTIYQADRPDTAHTRSILAGAPTMRGFPAGSYRVQVTGRDGLRRDGSFEQCVAVEVIAGEVAVVAVDTL